MTIGQRIRKLRKELRLRQKDIAAEVGVAESAVSQWENDHTTPEREHIGPLAKVLKTIPAYVEFGEAKPQSSRNPVKIPLYELKPNVLVHGDASEPSLPAFLRRVEGNGVRDVPIMNIKAVKVIGDVQAGVFKPALEWSEDRQFEVYLPITAPFGRVDLFGLKINGLSMDKVFPEGSVIICARLIDLGPMFELEDDLYVVVLRRDETGDVEATVKQFVRDKTGQAWLWPRSSHPDFQQPWRVLDLANSDDNDDLAVWALVVADTRMRV